MLAHLLRNLNIQKSYARQWNVERTLKNRSLSVHDLINNISVTKSCYVTLRFRNLLWGVDNKSNLCQTYTTILDTSLMLLQTFHIYHKKTKRDKKYFSQFICYSKRHLIWSIKTQYKVIILTQCKNFINKFFGWLTLKRQTD